MQVCGLNAGQRATFGAGHAFKVGLFGANLAGIGMSVIPERWAASWDDNVAVAKMAENAGIDFLLPVARWKGYGGATDPQGSSLETITWATGLLAVTRRITVFATVHVPLIHPLFAAKQFVTADQIGAGRFGLNIVCGWNDAEFEMFGVARKQDNRYDYAREWIEIVKQAWSRDDTFDVDSEFFHLRNVRALPKPWGATRPVLVSAAQSAEGVNFATRQCDVLFSNCPEDRNLPAWGASIDASRQAAGRLDMPVFTSCTVICRSTQKEAEDFENYLFDNGDHEAIDALIAIRDRSKRATFSGDIAAVRKRIAKGGGLYIVGDADQVAEQFAALHRIGINGVAAMFTNQLDELPFFVSEVLPRLERMGLRHTV
ncbi:MAG: LLM class flavin-dependent oxidoreductase [Janthinobacterium lividum]